MYTWKKFIQLFMSQDIQGHDNKNKDKLLSIEATEDNQLQVMTYCLYLTATLEEALKTTSSFSMTTMFGFPDSNINREQKNISLSIVQVESNNFVTLERTKTQKTFS